MRIDQITVFMFELETNLCFSYGTVTSQPFIIVKIDSGSYCGFGECVCRQVDSAVKCAQELIGRDVNQLEACLPEWMDAKEYRSVRESFSIALYDVAGRSSSSSVADLLGGRKRNPVPGVPVILVSTPADVDNKLQRYIRAGFKHIKLKFTGNTSADLELLREVRNASGRDFTIGADSNLGHKTYAEALQAAREFERYDLAIWEDPFHGSLAEYAHFRDRTSIDIMIDEYARSLADLKDVLQHQAADIINLHPNHQGGLGRAVQMKDLAAEFDIPVSIGGCGLLGISTAAFQSLASVIGLGFPCGELGGFYDHGIDVCLTANPYQISDGAIHIPDGHGLGVDVDIDKLKNICPDPIVIE